MTGELCYTGVWRQQSSSTSNGSRHVNTGAHHLQRSVRVAASFCDAAERVGRHRMQPHMQKGMTICGHVTDGSPWELEASH